MADMVNHPSHYADHYRVEVIELTALLDFCTGNAVKYLLRSRFKGCEAEDLNKAYWYLRYLLSGKCGYPKAFRGDKNALCKTFEEDLKTQGEDDLAWILGNIRRGQIASAQINLEKLIRRKTGATVNDAVWGRSEDVRTALDEEFL